MKRILYVILLYFLFKTGAYASCIYEEIDPVCGINGVTYTRTCDGGSDTSSWMIPIAYQGKCVNLDPLPNSEATRVHDIIKKYLSRYEGNYCSYNKEGQEFIHDILFPAIQNYISKEIVKENPNYRNIKILNYVASLIEYDYYIIDLDYIECYNKTSY